MRKRNWTIALGVSAVLHGAALTTVLWWTSRRPPHAAPPSMAVTWYTPGERAAKPALDSRMQPAVGPAARTRSAGPLHGAHPSPPPALAEPGVSLARSAAAPGPGREGSSAAGEWWAGRSLVEYVKACRGGNAARDSVLDPAPAPEQLALARTTRQLNELALHLRGEWMLEKWVEKVRESFPLMH